MDPRDVERPNKLRSEKRADWSSGSTWPISHVGCTDDMQDTRRERAVSTSSTSLCSWMVEEDFEVTGCEALASLDENASCVDERPEVVLEGAFWFVVVEAGCRILDLAISLERKLGRGGGMSSSSSPIDFESVGIYWVRSVSPVRTHDDMDLPFHE
jgi:hypothetical protein